MTCTDSMCIKEVLLLSSSTILSNKNTWLEGLDMLVQHTHWAIYNRLCSQTNLLYWPTLNVQFPAIYSHVTVYTYSISIVLKQDTLWTPHKTITSKLRITNMISLDNSKHSTNFSIFYRFTNWLIEKKKILVYCYQKSVCPNPPSSTQRTHSHTYLSERAPSVSW